jgi:tripartite-type tricarboxylate transporter receptor subunit TctC
LFAPRGTPRPIIEGLSNALDKALDDDNTRKRLIELGGDIPDKDMRGPQALARTVKSDIERWVPIIKAVNARAE